MILILTFLGLILGLFGFLWGGSLLLQGFLYNIPADRLPLRAAVAAMIMGVFLSGWVAIDQKHPGTYDTFFDFSSYDIKQFDQFTAIMKDRADRESEVIYKLRPGGRRSADYLSPSGEPFSRTGSDRMVIAIVVTEDEQEKRFDATLNERGNYITPVQYLEADSDRYMSDDAVGRVFDPKLGRVIVVLLLNFFHFVLWFVVIWLALRFGWGHAFGLAFLIGLAFMLVILPVLFEQN